MWDFEEKGLLAPAICQLTLGITQRVTVCPGEDMAAVLALAGALSLQAMELGLMKAGYLSKAFASVRVALRSLPLLFGQCLDGHKLPGTSRAWSLSTAITASRAFTKLLCLLSPSCAGRNLLLQHASMTSIRFKFRLIVVLGKHLRQIFAQGCLEAELHQRPGGCQAAVS